MNVGFSATLCSLPLAQKTDFFYLFDETCFDASFVKLLGSFVNHVPVGLEAILLLSVEPLDLQMRDGVAH